MAMGTTTPLRMYSSAARRVAMVVVELMTVTVVASMAASVAALASTMVIRLD